MLRNIAADVHSHLTRRWLGLVLMVALLAIVLLTTWGMRPTSRKEHTVAEVPQPLQPAIGDSPNQQLKQFTEEELGVRNRFLYTCREGSDPHGVYALARELHPAYVRETEMANIVVDAVCVGDESFALEIFARLTAIDQQDRAVKEVVAFYLKKKRFTNAKRWADFLSNTQDKQWWLRRILEASRRSPPA